MQVYKDIQVYVRYDICILLSGPLFSYLRFLFGLHQKVRQCSELKFRAGPQEQVFKCKVHRKHLQDEKQGSW